MLVGKQPPLELRRLEKSDLLTRLVPRTAVGAARHADSETPRIVFIGPDVRS